MITTNSLRIVSHYIKAEFKYVEKPGSSSDESRCLDLGQQHTFMSPKARPSLAMKSSWIRPHK